MAERRIRLTGERTAPLAMEEHADTIAEAEPADARLLWLRANRTKWKPICWELGLSRATANRRWQYGIAVIVWRLNGRPAPRKRSMEFVVAKAAR